MSTDLFLEDDAVVTRGLRLRHEGCDLEIRSPERLPRSAGEDPRRRALVHGGADQLILNYDSDYKETEIHGGVRICQRGDHQPKILVMDGRGKIGVLVDGARGQVSCKDLTLPVPWAGGGDWSVLEVLKWFDRRLKALEAAAGVEAEKLPGDHRRG